LAKKRQTKIIPPTGSPITTCYRINLNRKSEI
jgi:hypothetical protein